MLLRATLLLLSALAGAQEAQESARIKARMADKRPMTWVFTGDSITHGAVHTKGWRCFAEIFAERVRFEMRRPRDLVINTGISGDTTAGLMPDLEWRLTRFKPDVAFVMFGMNDCVAGPDPAAYEANLRRIIAEVRKGGGVPILMRVNPCVPGTPQDRRRARLAEYMAVVDKVAKAEKVLAIDHFGDWLRKPGEIRRMMNDDVHPNALGHQEMALRIFGALGFPPGGFTGKLSAPGQGR